jgi:transposase
VTARESLPTNLAGAHALILAERAARVEVEARLADARAEAPMRRRTCQARDRDAAAPVYGNRSERKARLLEQIELQLEELEPAATEDELAAPRRRRARNPSNRSSAGGLPVAPSQTICRESAW